MNDNNNLQELQKVAEKYKARNKYINDFQKQRYDRLICLLPKGQKQEIENRIKEIGINNISDYLRMLINADLKQAAGKDQE